MAARGRSATQTSPHPRAVEIEQFCRSNAQRVLGALVLLTGNRAAAEDALQEALAKAWHKRDQPIEQLTAWITVVASNQARSGWRRGQAEQRALDRSGSRRDGVAGDPGLGRGARGAAGEGVHVDSPRDDSMDAALAALPPRERQVAVLHYILDQSVLQCALAMNVSEGTVKTLLSRARAHLAEQLALGANGDGHGHGDGQGDGHGNGAGLGNRQDDSNRQGDGDGQGGRS